MLSSSCHGMRVHAQKLRHLPIAAVSEFERLQAGVQASLLFVEQAEVHTDFRHALIRPFLPAENAPAQAGLRFLRPPNPHLVLANSQLRRTIQVSSRDRFPANPRRTKQ